jgi:hypothetical protein
LAGTTASFNSALGTWALQGNTIGTNNSAFGVSALVSNSTGSHNIGLGNYSLWNNTTGNSNVAIGNSAGYDNTTGSASVFLGNQAGRYETTGNRLYIENSNADADNALIYGEFDNDILRTNGTLQIGNPTLTGFAFPITDGAANQILQTDGSGALTWQDQAAGGATEIDELSDAKSIGGSLFLGFASGSNDDGTLNRNTAAGSFTLDQNTFGSDNTALGYSSLTNNTTGSGNTAIGSNALYENTTSYNNSAYGESSLRNNNGEDNSGFGAYTLFTNTTGEDNTALGRSAGYLNVSGSGNIFLGRSAGYNEIGSDKLYIANSSADADNALVYGEFDNNILRTNGTLQIGNPTATGFAFPTTDGTANQILQTDGSGALTWQDQVVGGATNIDELSDAINDGSSVFVGTGSGNSDDGGNSNTAVGISALRDNLTGVNNAAIGANALVNNTSGFSNSALGLLALSQNTTGNDNTAIGVVALSNNSSGTNNTSIGSSSGNGITSGSNNTTVGAHAQVPDGTLSNQVRIGNASVTLIEGQVAWSFTSDKRWKDEIRDLPYGLNMVTKLQPVDYIRKNNELKTRETGFIAQDVEKVLQDLGYNDQGFLTKDDQGRMSLRYNDLIAVLTKAIQEQQEIIEKQNEKLDSQDKNYEKLLKRVEQLEVATKQ